MRLKSIKLAGFKSFVDPTTVPFPGNLCAIVGPNGCGKSNIIDAVRWVMGESSAKNLRGESMVDVIFNGSNTRKPVGQASIELQFDNSDGSLGGEYSQYADISIKRVVGRDAQSDYYLNGTRCRRRDITDIFLGTGLGPRSYAIIEQGMISRLIDAKPEELRIYVEEAAGISKYKERRRETENRIRHTRENLERLGDVREELERQLNHLQRQAHAAEKFTEYKQEERLKKAQLQTLRWKSLEGESVLLTEKISTLEVAVEAKVAKQRHIDSELEKQREHFAQQSEELNEVNGRFYGVGSEIARVEQSIQYQKERSKQLQDDLTQTEQGWKEAAESLRADREKQETLQASLLEVEPDLETAKAAEEETTGALLSAEEKMHLWQNEWDGFNQRSLAPRQIAEVEQSRIQHVEQVMDRLRERTIKLEAEKVNLAANSDDVELVELKKRVTGFDLTLQSKQDSAEKIMADINAQRDSHHFVSKEIDVARSELQRLQGRHASLEALQQAALNQNKDTISWLEKQQLSKHERLSQHVKVASGWETALETVLGGYLQAVCMDNVDAASQLLGDFNNGNLYFIDSTSAGKTSEYNKSSTLLSKVTSTISVGGLLAGIYVADDLATALALRKQLSNEESVITKEGIWLGANWLRVARDKDAQRGVLQRKQEIEELSSNIAQLDERVNSLQVKLDEMRENTKTLEQEREVVQRELATLNREQSEWRAQLSAKQVRIEQIAMRRERTDVELVDIQTQIKAEQEQLGQARLNLQTALDEMEKDAQQREKLLVQRDENRTTLDHARQAARHDKDRAHQLDLRYQSIKMQLDSVLQAMDRLTIQSERLSERRQQLKLSLAENDSPIEGLQEQLTILLEKRLSVQEELTTARQKVEAIEHELRELDKQRHIAEEEAQQVRSQLEQGRMDFQAIDIRRKTLQEQLAEAQFDIESVLATLPEEAEEDRWNADLETISAKIQRLGPINLAAIDEFQSSSERKIYLDAQNADLVEALDTLENAIRKIDRETRTRFKETFDKINSHLGELFPKVFGGGHAYLEMTGEELLDTGVAIMARPPGKRNSTIHLLSGGEKALTAIALVFSIFQLNPAPFCMLDEVDAPLDDANTARYSRLVEEMSKKVQFIYITHNKIAMEMAHQLMGVTMHEPGVSRLVAVDVEEAAAMAAL
jgi:chromosome segregation protein